MSIRKQPNGTYIVDFRPNGTKGTRLRKRFDTQGEAKRFVQYTLANLQDKAWQPEKVDICFTGFKEEDRKTLTEQTKKIT